MSVKAGTAYTLVFIHVPAWTYSFVEGSFLTSFCPKVWLVILCYGTTLLENFLRFLCREDAKPTISMNISFAGAKNMRYWWREPTRLFYTVKFSWSNPCNPHRGWLHLKLTRIDVFHMYSEFLQNCWTIFILPFSDHKEFRKQVKCTR